MLKTDLAKHLPFEFVYPRRSSLKGCVPLSEARYLKIKKTWPRSMCYYLRARVSRVFTSPSKGQDTGDGHLQ